jgi:signal transduction histidine kinase
MMDRDRMRRVVVNIVNNAAKYMDKKHGEIKIKLRDTRTSFIAEIHDNGAGIDKEDLPHIFDRFFRADSSRNGVAGSGLGLAIARQIVEGHEGSIWAVSSKGEGTSIIISLRKSI